MTFDKKGSDFQRFGLILSSLQRPRRRKNWECNKEHESIYKSVARHFDAANHSISDIKVCAILPISSGNDCRKASHF